MGIGTIGASSGAVSTLPKGAASLVSTSKVNGYNSLGSLAAGSYVVETDKEVLIWGANGSIVAGAAPGSNRITIPAEAAGECFVEAIDYNDATVGTTIYETDFNTFATTTRREPYGLSNHYTYSQNGNAMLSAGSSYCEYLGADGTVERFGTAELGSSDSSTWEWALGTGLDNVDYIYQTAKLSGVLNYRNPVAGTTGTINVTVGGSYSSPVSVTTDRHGRWFAIVAENNTGTQVAIVYGQGTTMTSYFYVNAASATGYNFGTSDNNLTVRVDPSSDMLVVWMSTPTSYEFSYATVNINPASMPTTGQIIQQTTTIYMGSSSTAAASCVWQSKFALITSTQHRTQVNPYLGRWSKAGNGGMVNSQSEFNLDRSMVTPGGYSSGTHSSYPTGIISGRAAFAATGYVSRLFTYQASPTTVGWQATGLAMDVSGTSVQMIPLRVGTSGHAAQGLTKLFHQSTGGYLKPDGELVLSNGTAVAYLRTGTITFYEEA
jgi:hypothetical protein